MKIFYKEIVKAKDKDMILVWDGEYFTEQGTKMNKAWQTYTREKIIKDNIEFIKIN